MNVLLAPFMAGLLTPVAAMLPAGLVPDSLSQPGEAAVVAPAEAPAADWARDAEPASPDEPGLKSFADAVRLLREAERAQQVRIERSVTIRIMPGPIVRGSGPASRVPRRNFMADLEERAAPRLVERRMAQCLPVAGIARVQPDGPSRLILFMRDQRIVSAALEKGCNARDYYSGFLVERTSDGMICAARDKLLARTGGNCELDRLRQLIELDPDE